MEQPSSVRYDAELIPLEALTRVDKPRLSQTLPIRKGRKFWERDTNAEKREEEEVWPFWGQCVCVWCVWGDGGLCCVVLLVFVLVVVLAVMAMMDGGCGGVGSTFGGLLSLFAAQPLRSLLHTLSALSSPTRTPR